MASGAFSAADPPDVAAFSGLVGLIGAFNAGDPPDTAAFAGRVNLIGALDATDEPDTAAFEGRAWYGAFGELAATDDPDTAFFRARAWPGARCQGKTVCMVGERAKDPELVASLRDRDTDTCRTWAATQTAVPWRRDRIRARRVRYDQSRSADGYAASSQEIVGGAARSAQPFVGKAARSA